MSYVGSDAKADTCSAIACRTASDRRRWLGHEAAEDEPPEHRHAGDRGGDGAIVRAVAPQAGEEFGGRRGARGGHLRAVQHRIHEGPPIGGVAGQQVEQVCHHLGRSLAGRGEARREHRVDHRVGVRREHLLEDIGLRTEVATAACGLSRTAWTSARQ